MRRVCGVTPTFAAAQAAQKTAPAPTPTGFAFAAAQAAQKKLRFGEK